MKNPWKPLSPIARTMVCIDVFGASLAWLKYVLSGYPDFSAFVPLGACFMSCGGCIGSLVGRTRVGAIIGLLLTAGIFFVAIAASGD